MSTFHGNNNPLGLVRYFIGLDCKSGLSVSLNLPLSVQGGGGILRDFYEECKLLTRI